MILTHGGNTHILMRRRRRKEKSESLRSVFIYLFAFQKKKNSRDLISTVHQTAQFPLL